MKEKTKTPLRSRKRAALRCIVIALVVMTLVNHFMHIGLLLPRQAYHELEERSGLGWTRVVARDWTPEIHKTHIAYLSGDEAGTLFGSVYFTFYGWMPAFQVTLDCTAGEPLYAGRSFMYRDEARVWYFFGRVDDPQIKRVEISLCSEEYDEESHAYRGREVRRVAGKELIERDGRRYFFLQDGGEWDHDAYSSPRPVAIGYDDAGREVARLEINEGNSSSFG